MKVYIITQYFKAETPYKVFLDKEKAINYIEQKADKTNSYKEMGWENVWIDKGNSDYFYLLYEMEVNNE